MIPYGKQDVNQADIDAVINVLESDYITQGPQVPLFHAMTLKQQDEVHSALKMVLR